MPFWAQNRQRGPFVNETKVHQFSATVTLDLLSEEQTISVNCFAHTLNTAQGHESTATL